MTPADSGIADAADLDGQSLGIPGRYGSSLDHAPGAARVGRADRRTTSTSATTPISAKGRGFTRARSTPPPGFRNNEPVQLQREGFPTNLLTIDDITPLPGPGLTVGEVNACDRKPDGTQGVRRRHAARHE